MRVTEPIAAQSLGIRRLTEYRGTEDRAGARAHRRALPPPCAVLLAAVRDRIFETCHGRAGGHVKGRRAGKKRFVEHGVAPRRHLVTVACQRISASDITGRYLIRGARRWLTVPDARARPARCYRTRYRSEYDTGSSSSAHDERRMAPARQEESCSRPTGFPGRVRHTVTSMASGPSKARATVRSARSVSPRR